MMIMIQDRSKIVGVMTSRVYKIQLSF